MSSPSLTIGGVSCSIPLEDLGEGAIVENAPEGDVPSATVVFQCAYADRYKLLKGLKGSTTSSGRTVIRTPAFAYPPSPNLRCVDVSNIHGIKPRTGSDGWVSFQKARMTATFKALTWQFQANDPAGQNDPSGQAYTRTKFRGATEVYSPPGGSYYLGPFSPNGKPLQEGTTGIVRAKVEIAMTRLWYPFVPLNEIKPFEGSVNLNPLVISNYSFPAGYVLFSTFDTSDSTDPLGNPTFDITYYLLANFDADWNHAIDNQGNYQLMNTKVDGTGNPPFSSVDYANLP